MSRSLRIIFAGTSDFAAHHLSVLIRAKHQVVSVLIQPDRPSGRGNQLIYSPVKQLAKSCGLPIFQPFSLRNFEEQKLIASLRADIMVVVAYGLIIPQEILELPRLGCINVHGSLLPRWRGAAPVQRALCAGDNQTGITIIQMNNNLDTGAMLHKVSCNINPNDTSASLHNKLAQIGSNALLYVLEKLTNGYIKSELQNNKFATYANKLNKSEAKINWQLSAIKLERCIRAFNPWPISYFFLSGKLVKVWAAKIGNYSMLTSLIPGTVISLDKTGIHVVTGDGVIILTKLQLAGKKVISAHDLLNSRREWFTPGTLLI